MYRFTLKENGVQADSEAVNYLTRVQPKPNTPQTAQKKSLGSKLCKTCAKKRLKKRPVVKKRNSRGQRAVETRKESKVPIGLLPLCGGMEQIGIQIKGKVLRASDQHHFSVNFDRCVKIAPERNIFATDLLAQPGK
ncbi:hypothetical protein niasHT_037203 [Heterodera trifolii]|uniref:Uncharacterized protein n=1 Tax=Heterodera trifolii TaxID=157864 RepID=A0ABD2IDP1_9BILA